MKRSIKEVKRKEKNRGEGARATTSIVRIRKEERE